MKAMITRWRPSPQPWSDTLDFVGPRVRTSVVGWALLALGLVAVLHGTDRMDAARLAMDEAQTTLKRLQRGGRQMAVHTQAAASQAQDEALTAPELGATGWQHAAQLAQGLGFEWADVLGRIEDTADKEQVVLLQLSLDLATLGAGPDTQPELKLQAAVRDDAHALQWLEHAGPNVSLRSRERLTAPFTTSRGTYAWRVDMSIRGGRP